jgi:hypothetical protein
LSLPQATIFHLKYARVTIAFDDESLSNSWVSTTLLSFGVSCTGAREDTPTNRREAEMEGYTPDAVGVWQSLVEHEILHSLVAQHLWDCESYVIRAESGAELTPLHNRYFEESLVLGLQWTANRVSQNSPLSDLQEQNNIPLALDMYLDSEDEEWLPNSRKVIALLNDFWSIRERLGFK